MYQSVLVDFHSTAAVTVKVETIAQGGMLEENGQRHKTSLLTTQNWFFLPHPFSHVKLTQSKGVE